VPSVEHVRAVRIIDVTRLIVNANDSVMGAAAVLRGIDCRARILIPQPTEWQHIGNRIDTAFVCAPEEFVNVL
jgi:hypothetical protein